MFLTEHPQSGMAPYWGASVATASDSFSQEIHDPVLSPVGIFAVPAPMEEAAVPSVAGRRQNNLRMPLDVRLHEH